MEIMIQMYVYLKNINIIELNNYYVITKEQKYIAGKTNFHTAENFSLELKTSLSGIVNCMFLNVFSTK